MAVSLLSLLLALLGQPLNIISPRLAYPEEILQYQPAILVASPMARTSLECYQLHGPLSEVRLEFPTPSGKTATSQRFLQTMQFDTHGNLTRMVRYPPIGKMGVTQRDDVFTIANQYDDQQRLQLSALTATQQNMPQVKVDAQRLYDKKGRLSEVRATLTDLTSVQKTQVSMNIASTLDASGRLAGQQCWLAGIPDTTGIMMDSAYRYETAGVSVVEPASNRQKESKKRQWFDEYGRLAELDLYDATGHVELKIFFRYNTQGDILRFSKYGSDDWTRIAFDGYVNDEHGNWTKRTCYSLQLQNGKDILTPEAIQNRTLTYYTQDTPTGKGQ